MTSRTCSLLILGLVVLVAGFAVLVQSQAGARAQSGCTLATLQGEYTWEQDGYYIDGDKQTPFAYAGRESYDGLGGLTGVYSGASDGEPARFIKYSGTYTVNSDCTGSLITTDEGSDAQTNYDIFIDATNGNFFFAATDSGTVSQGTNRKQN